MFYRYAADTNGSGLGLFIVKEVVAKLGGTISLKSAQSLGTVFTVNVPVSAISEKIEVQLS
jgi:signal transduction histidine kinase